MYIYILKCEDGSLYTGISGDMEKRIKQHLGIIKGGAKYTRSHRIVSVEALWHTDMPMAARKLEYALKQLSHSQKSELIGAPEELCEKYCTDLSDFIYEYSDAEKYSNFLKDQSEKMNGGKL